MQQEEWIVRLRANDQTALEELIGQYAAYLYTVAHVLAGNTLSSEDLEEVTADAFFRLWTHRAALNPKGSLKWYLVQTTRHLTTDRLRGRKAAALPLLEHLTAGEEVLQSNLERKELLARLAKHLDSLPPQEREILERFYGQGQRAKEIAAAMGLSHGAVRTRLTRLRAALRSDLEGENLL